MSLISILLFATAVLTLLTGFMTVMGSSKSDRKHSLWFMLSATANAAWAISIALFLALTSESEAAAPGVILGIYLSALLVSPSMLGYTSWKYKIGKVLTIASLAMGCVLGGILIGNQDLLYTSYTVSRMGNSVELINNWFYWLYMMYFVIVMSAFCIMTYYRARHATTKRIKTGMYVLLGGMVPAALCSTVFDLILPLWVRYDLIWVGPLMTSVTVIAFFYAALKYRIISIATRWLRVMAYAVIMSAGAAIYMVLFYIIFTALFKIPNPSTSVLVLNFVMIVIVLLLMPVIQEISASIKSLIQVGQVDIAYVIKKLNHLATKNIDLRDLAGFLADHLHFAYIGFIINGRLYGSKSLAISPAELSSISHLKPATREIWQEPNKTVQKTFDELGLYAVAELRNAKGKAFGQLVVGKPLGKASFERRDLLQLEMLINLVATVIDSEKHLRA